MRINDHPSARRSLLKVALVASLAIGCQAAASPTRTPAPPATTVPAGGVQLGALTLSDTGCRWDGNPGSITTGLASITVRNETDDHGLFILHRIRDGRTWEDGLAAVALIQEALLTGAEWPDEVFEVSEPAAEADVEANADGVIRFGFFEGTWGVVCSANTSSTGDILTTFLSGPLQVGPRPT